jgi:hypothetical protein
LAENLTPNADITTGGTNNYCYFSSVDPSSPNPVTTGRTIGIDMDTLAQSNLQLASQLNTFKTGCNCLGTCKNANSNNSANPLWKPFFENMFQIGQGNSCEQVKNMNLTACLSSVVAGGSIEDTGNNAMICFAGGTPTDTIGPQVR